MALTQITTNGIKDGTITGTDLATNIDLVDNQKLRLGTGNDLEIFHSGSHSFIANTGGQLAIRCNTTLHLSDDTGADHLKATKDGSVELYYDGSLKANTRSDGFEIKQHLTMGDSDEIRLGNSSDLKIFHNGTHSRIVNSTGNLEVGSSQVDIVDAALSQYAARLDTDGAVSLYHNGSKKFETTSTGATVTGQIISDGLQMGDSDIAKFGSHDDLQIYHDGSNSFIDESSGTGRLKVRTGGMDITTEAGAETIATFNMNGAVELYHNNSKKFETTSYGALLTGNLKLADSGIVSFGDGDDLQIYHDGSNSYIGNGTGDIILENSGGNTSNQLRFRARTGEESIVAHGNGAVELYHDNSKKFQTYASGIQFFGNIKNETDGTGNGLYLGAANDFQFYHDGNRSAVNNRTGELRLTCAGDIRLGRADSGGTTSYDELYAAFISNGAVELYHDNEKTFETIQHGIQITDNDTSVQINMVNSNGTIGYLYGGASGDFGLLDGQGHYTVKGIQDGAVELYHDNSKKFETTSAGATITGDLEVTGSITSTSRNNRNLIINGAMQVAQRGTSSTDGGYRTVDRFRIDYGGQDEALTQAQADVTSGGAYDAGFRKCLKVTNGNQTGGAGASDYSQILTRLEAQDIANSGWNYKSSSSFITLSFWVKSSVAQVFSGSLRAVDGTAYSYKFDTPSLSANTWTKVTKTIAGNSNLTFNNDNTNGLDLYFFPAIFSTYASSNSNTETWITANSNTYANLTTSTWWTTNDATFEITGVQLEVGSVATDFEHRSFAQELTLCQRYFAEAGVVLSNGTPNRYHNNISLPVEMRALPTRTAVSIDSGSGGNMYPNWDRSGSANSKRQFYQGSNNSQISNAFITFDAEL